MALVAAVCPNCGGKINVDDTKEAGICESCGTPFVTEKVIHQNVTNNNFAGATVNMTMSLAVDDQKQFTNAMQMAMDSYNAGNEEECKSFCNQALSVNPKSADAKALKGSAVLISFSLAGATSDAVEALKIWETISEAPSSEYCNIAVEAAFDFRSRWLEAAEAHYNEFKTVEGAKAEYNQVKQNYKDFMDRFAEIEFVRNYEPFSDLTLQLVREGNGTNLKEITFAPILAYANKDRTDSIGVKAKQILEAYSAADEAHKKAVRTKIIIGVVIFVLLAIIGHFME